jgi:hypothetical protein
VVSRSSPDETQARVYHQQLWLEVLNQLTDLLLRKLTNLFIHSDKTIDLVVSLKHSISEEWVEDLIYQFCFRNRMLLPQKNGSMGLAVLKIIEVLKKVRGISNIFELLDSEQTRIQRKLNN